MKTVAMKATREHVYQGCALTAGDIFEAAPRDALLLLGLRKARLYRVPVVKPVVNEVEAEPVKSKRRYRRRDMTAEA